MHHRLPAVDDDPFSIGLALEAGLGETSLAYRIRNAAGQCLGLTVGTARSHNDPLKQRREVFGIKHLDVLRFHVFQTIDDGPLEFLNVFFGGGGSSHQVAW